MNKTIFLYIYLSTIFLFFIFSCFPYLYFEREKVLIENVDIDQTLCISEIELKEGGFDSILTIWALRDQKINENQAKRIEDQYFQYIDKLTGEFEIWHLAWAIANYYRWGDEKVKNILENAYKDAQKRPDTLNQFKAVANEHINGKRIYAGDIHDLARSYARTHIVVPGNKKFIQSMEEYLERKKKENKNFEINKEEWLNKCKALVNNLP